MKARRRGKLPRDLPTSLRSNGESGWSGASRRWRVGLVQKLRNRYINRLAGKSPVFASSFVSLVAPEGETSQSEEYKLE